MNFRLQPEFGRRYRSGKEGELMSMGLVAQMRRLRVPGAALACVLALPATSQAQSSAAAACPAKVSPAAYRSFADKLLARKQPREAYEDFADAAMVQRNPPFGATRDSTVKQWETMTTLPGSHFEITSVRVRGDMGEIRFLGHLKPGEPGARITQRDRFHCGRIVEEWGEFQPLKDK